MLDLSKLFSSSEPLSLQRVAGIFKEILPYYPALKNQLLSGSPKEQERIISWTVQLFEELKEEIARTCDTLKMPFKTFQQQIITYFSPEEALLYQEADRFIKAHRGKIFSFQPFPKSENRPKFKSARVYC